MNVLTVSDLHNEFYRHKKQPIPDINVDAPIDLVIFAGDIDTGTKGMAWAIEQAKKLNVPAVYIPGNHEFYGKNYHSTVRKMDELSQGSPVTLLVDKAIVINGVQLIGAILWTDFELLSRDTRESAMREAGELMSDYSKIRMDVRGTYAKLKPLDTLRMHTQSMQFIEATLEKEFEGTRIIATHHAPSVHSIEEDDRENMISTAYASELSSTMRLYDIDLWVHGHTHVKVDYELEGTRVFSNPKGYPGQLKDYQEEVVSVLSVETEKSLTP